MFQFTDTKAASEKGAWVHLKDRKQPAYWPGKDGRPDKSRPVRVKVLGPDSPTLQERMRKAAARRLKETGGTIDMSKMSQSEIEAFLANAEDYEPENWALATIDWENMPDTDGKGELEFSREAAQAVYARFPSILRQLKDEASDPDDFLALAEQS